MEGMRVTGQRQPHDRQGARALLRERVQGDRAHDRHAGIPQVRTVFEIGGESSKYIRLENGGIQDYDRSGECAAGTGSFLDQQALRMQYSVEEVGELVCGAGCAARIAGRCSRVRQERHDPRAAEGLFAGRDPARAVRRGGAELQEFGGQGAAGGGAGGADRRGVAERRAWCGRCARRSR